MTTETTTGIRTYGHLIAGTSEDASSQLIVRESPATGKPVAAYSEGTAEDVERAVAAARQAFDEGTWAGTPGIDKAKILHRWADLIERDVDRLAHIEVEEVGKPIRQARGDIEGSVGLIRYAASLSPNIHGEVYTNLGDDYAGFVVREPVGVVGMIVP